MTGSVAQSHRGAFSRRPVASKALGSSYRLIRPTRSVPRAPTLDAGQRRVVDHSGGPLLVLAGPGTGKTTTLVEAVVARVEAGVPVDQLLMLTFSRRAAGELRDRVTARLDRTLPEPIARTLHSYAFGVLRLAALAQELPAPRLLSAPEQDVLLREILGGRSPELWPVELRPALYTRAFAGELRELLMRAVERGLNGPDLAELGRARGRVGWVAAGQFLTEYHNVISLEHPSGYDPAELIRSALNVLHDDPELLATERSKRRHIFVDEYQDTDPAQAELLSLLGAGASELILVGDPDQSIYAFRGANESAIADVDRYFSRGDKAVPVLALTQCRRAGAALLAASRRIANSLPGRAEQRRLVPAAGLDPGAVEVALLRSAHDEAAYIAGTLRRAHLAGMPFSRMAVLVRSTSQVLAPLRRAFAAAGVPVAVRGEDLPLAEQPAVRLMLQLLGCALDSTAITESVAEQLLVGPIGGADSLYVRRLRRVLRQLAVPNPGAVTELGAAGGTPRVPDLAAALLDPLGAAVLPERVRRPVERIASVLAAGRVQAAVGGNAEAVLWALWDATGLATRWEASSKAGGAAGAAADRDLDAVIELFETAGRFADRLPAANAAEFAEYLNAQQIPGDSLSSTGAEPESVSILTAHASKGLEWDLVCIANVQEGVWPDLRPRGSLLHSEELVEFLEGRAAAGVSTSAPLLAEERRLFYVAVTRARRRVVITAVGGDDEQPSRFLDEIDPLPEAGSVDGNSTGPTDADRPYAVLPRGVHLPGVVAELRAAVIDLRAPLKVRTAAASELGRLMAARVAGADPDCWWGLGELSTSDPVADPDKPVPVSPSKLGSFLDCEVHALLTDLGARDEEQIPASLGTLIHDIAATAPVGTDLVGFEERLSARWSELDFDAPWFAEHERARASVILRRLVGWLGSSRSELSLVAVEEGFGVEVGDVVLRGRVDRLEQDIDGRLVVVDLKTGMHKPTKEEVPKHPQLAAYQLAVESGAFTQSSTAGGALLVQLGAGGSTEQRQAALADSEEPEWIREQVAFVASRLRGHEFTATLGSHCRNCDVRGCCPIVADGRQVTG